MTDIRTTVVDQVMVMKLAGHNELETALILIHVVAARS